VRILVGEAWRGLRSEPGAVLLSVVIVGLALYIPSMLYLTARAGDRFSQQVRSQVKLRIYLREDAPGPFDELSAQLSSLPQVREVTYRDRDDLLTELEAELGKGLLDGLPGNPLPRAIDVTVRPESATEYALDSLASKLSAYPETEEVVYGRAWAHRADRFFGEVRFLLGLITVLLGLFVLAIAANIIRLIIRTRRESIGVWLLLGASPLYARLPYYIEGALAGLAGAAVTLALLYGTCTWLSGFVPAFAFFTLTEALLFTALSVVTALLGAALAARRQIVPL
jgi:cell division transport system permease protein